GVGSARQPIAARTTQGFFVAPDNGVLTGVLRQAGGYSAVRLENPAYRLSEPSNTFHGRDIFAPAAAHLAAGVSLEQLGSGMAALRELASPPLAINGNAVRGEVVAIDHFGNVMTSIRVLRWLDSDTLTFAADDEHASVRFSAAPARVMIGWHTLTGIRQTYSLVDPDETLALVSSSGELEIAVIQGNASERLSLSLGDPVTLMLADALR
ncbi:MAG: SAM-dependent chlorinase/fluorinase, partial [Anaerolineae bacterium]|nr:SAM-dependent chlorinase/fluorinase [Anaerolineae bacterium]